MSNLFPDFCRDLLRPALVHAFFSQSAQVSCRILESRAGFDRVLVVESVQGKTALIRNGDGFAE